MTRARLLLPLLLLPLAACSAPPEWQPVIDGLGQSHVEDLLWASAKWGALGGVAGACLGLISFGLLSKLGAYTWEWRLAWLFRALTALLLVICLGLTGAGIGLGQGVLSGGEVMLREGQLGKRALVPAGDAGADCFFFLERVTSRLAAGESPESAFEVPASDYEGFRSGTQTCAMAAFNARTCEVPEEKIEALANTVADLSVGKEDAEEDAEGESKVDAKRRPMLRAAVRELVSFLVRRQIREQIEGVSFTGAGKVLTRAYDEIKERPQISRSELSQHLVGRVAIPILMLPVKNFVRSQQMALLPLALLALLLPPLCFFGAESIRKRMAGPEPPTPVGMTS